MIEDLFHRFSAFIDLTLPERSALHDTVGQGSLFDAAQQIALEGDETTALFFLHEGWVLSGITHPDGSHQVLNVHRSGDLMGMSSLPFETAIESLVALTSSRVSTITLSKFDALLAAFPRLGSVTLLIAQEERVTLMDRLAIGGRLTAKHSVAALMLLMFDGRPPSEGHEAKLHVPLTQTQIADVLGLSTVHVNRVMNALEAEGLIKRDGALRHNYELPDVPRLKELIGTPERVRRRVPTRSG